jgi:hypothetical protein
MGADRRGDVAGSDTVGDGMNLDELERLAKAATPYGQHARACTTEYLEWITAANPQVVAALVACVRASRALRYTHGEPCTGCKSTRDYDAALANLNRAMGGE